MYVIYAFLADIVTTTLAQL